MLLLHSSSLQKQNKNNHSDQQGEHYHLSMRTRIENRQTLLEARENANDQVEIVFSLASDWLRGWREFSRPIRELSYVKTNQSRIAFDNQLKIALRQNKGTA